MPLASLPNLLAWLNSLYISCVSGASLYISTKTSSNIPFDIAPPAPPATTSTSTDDKPLGTEKVPEDVNDVTDGAFIVIVNCLSLVFEALSLALIVNVEVVLLI